MKKLICLAAICAVMSMTLPCVFAVTSIIAPALEAQGLIQIGHLVTQIQNTYESAMNTYNQFQNMLRAEERMLNNLKGVTDIKNWDDFMKWANRQMYLEKQAEDRFTNMGVKIGGKSYTMQNIEDIPAASKNYFNDLFKDDFSDAERKEIFVKMGLTPSNYTYLQTWNTREKNLAKSLLTKKDTINADNMTWFERMKNVRDILTSDATKPEDEKLQEKGLLQYILEVMMDTNRVQREMSYDQAVKNEYEVSKDKQNEAPANPPMLSDSFNDNMFFGIEEYVGNN
ncbi:MAG: hypothetical protein LBD20_07595 [Spirochaetaceae bacterium]|jgi:hypothetical protein|nr:hypothetical protein [Spirochaetaceae bacterium]